MLRLRIWWPDGAEEVVDLGGLGPAFDSVRLHRGARLGVDVMVGRRVPETGEFDYVRVTCDAVKLRQFVDDVYRGH